MKQEPLEVTLIEKQKDLIVATVTFLQARGLDRLTQGTAKGAIIGVYKAKHWDLQQDYKAASCQLAKRLRTMICHYNRACGQVSVPSWAAKISDLVQPESQADAVRKRPASATAATAPPMKRPSG
eukprot:9471706-Pyramimonas_sp.AAC.1